MIINDDEIAPVHPDFEDDMPTIYYVYCEVAGGPGQTTEMGNLSLDRSG